MKPRRRIELAQTIVTSRNERVIEDVKITMSVVSDVNSGKSQKVPQVEQNWKGECRIRDMNRKEK